MFFNTKFCSSLKRAPSVRLKMPIFKRKVSKKRSVESQITEDLDDFKSITINLCDKKNIKFVNGVWIVLNNQSTESVDSTSELVKTNQTLERENYMLNAKMEILVDLLSETLAKE